MQALWKLTGLVPLLMLFHAPVVAQQAPGITDKGPQHAPPSSLAHSLEPQNPYMAAGGAAAEHNDSYSSDVSPLAGPGGSLKISVTKSGSLCPTLVLDKHSYVFAYCIETVTRRASLRLLDPESLEILASQDIPRSGRLGGFYMYMDQNNRLVLGSGDDHLLRINHGKNRQGRSELRVLDNWDLSKDVTSHCGSSECDYLESVTPDWTGRIWFSTEGGVVGTLDPTTGAVHSVTLPDRELVANSISSSPVGVAVPSDHALYLFSASPDGTPRELWREVYDRGTKTKLGQLSHGTGATPVFFGREGHPYLGITDNADEQEHLLVYRVEEAPEGKRLVCEVPLFSPGASANENAPVGIGDSVVVANTYGYDYNDYTGHAVRPLPGGLTRIDVRSGGSSCDVVWTNPVSSAAVPKLSIADGNIYTVERTVTASTPLYHLVAIDFRTGQTVSEKLIGSSYALDTFQLPAVIGPHRVLYQPTISGIVQLRPEAGR